MKSTGIGSLASGFSQGMQNGLALYAQYNGVQRQEKLNQQADAKFKAWQDQQDYDAETRRQEAGLADQVRNGAVNASATAGQLNASTAGNADAEQWTPAKVQGLSRGPGGAFDPNAGPAIPVQRDPLKQSDFNRQSAGLAMRKGDMAIAAQAMAQAKAASIDDAVTEAMATRAKDPDLYDDHLMSVGNLSGNMPATFKPIKGRGGYISMDVIGADGQVTTKDLSPAQRAQLALGHAYMTAGAYDKGIGHLEQVDKDLADAIVRKNENLFKGAQANNQAAHFANTDDYHNASLSVQRAHLAISQQQARKGDAVQLVDDQGNAHLYYLPTNTGQGEVSLPQGLHFPRQRPQVDETAVQKYVDLLLNTNDGLILTPDGKRVAGPDGKPMQYTPLTARQAVISSMYGKGDSLGGLPVPDASIKSRAQAWLAQLVQTKPPALGLTPPKTLREISQGLIEADANKRSRDAIRQGAATGARMQPADYPGLEYLTQ